ncbi:hypothetical protein [Microbacterium aurugineum]|uniref:hypothetical protein n=1 Tax=Microbacterium aurugineum TaxID=2851642 RepID=UPI0020BEA41C|nr:hypothetical protein [Microbacterium aurugineum]MCK8477203.1 hypothetical protein [Microbacterium aurugineum]
MTDTFTASNGIEVTVDPDREGKVYLVGRRARGDEGQYLDTHATGGPEGIVALREFFQHERDEELGRWRWSENPSFVVYPSRLFLTPSDEDLVHVINESNGQAHRVQRGDGERLFGYFSEAAYAYFEAHPERKPWHTPDAGDHWALHIAHGMALSGDEHLYKYTRWGVQGKWGFVPTDGGSVLDPTDATITSGRRIWPEDAS